MTSKELLSKISVSSETDTRVLTITVTDEDPYEACQIANAVRDVAANHIKNVMDIDAVNVVETANIPQEKSSPSLAKNGILGGALGLFLAIAIVLIVYLSNDTVKTQEDVEKYLGLSVLGTIPLMDMANTSGKSKKQKNKRRRRS
jgi:capsular polysaccharide biosynthesis protein